MFNAVNILEALKNYIRTRGGQSAANNIAEAVNDLNSIPQGSGGDIPDEVTNAIETHGMGWTSEPETIINVIWDGNIEGKEVLSEGAPFYLMTDDVFTKEELIGATLKGYVDGVETSVVVTESMLQIFDNLIVITPVGDDSTIVVYTGDISQLIEDAPSGTWFSRFPIEQVGVDSYPSLLYKTEEVVHQIDQKYIPQGPEVTNAIETHGMGWTEEEEVSAINIEWDGNAEGLERDASGLYAKISDLDIPNDQIVGLKFDTSYVSTHEFEKTIEITQEKFESLVSAGVITEDFSFLDSFVIIHKDGAVLEDIEFPHKGIYDYAAEDAATYTSRIYKEASTEEVVHQIDQKYIPQGQSGGMVVKVTADLETFALSADKTFAEIQEAFRAGVNVIADLYLGEDYGGSAACIACGNASAYFGMVFIDEETSNVKYTLECRTEDDVDEWTSGAF